MLDEYRQIYVESANIVGDWKSMSCLDLCNSYLETRETNRLLSESYLSAIICKYWGQIGINYNKQQFKNASLEDCYNWVIDAIIYVLDKHVWTDPNNALYNDPVGPDKAINVCISSARLAFYTYTTKQKRALNYNKVSLTNLENDSGEYDWAIPPIYDEDITTKDLIFRKVRDYFIRKDYFSAFALDALINADVYVNKVEGDKIVTEFSRGRIKGHFHHLDNSYCEIFSTLYNLDYDLVVNSLKYIVNITDDRFNRNLSNLFKVLSKDKEILAMAKEGKLVGI